MVSSEGPFENALLFDSPSPCPVTHPHVDAVPETMPDAKASLAARLTEPAALHELQARRDRRPTRQDAAGGIEGRP